MNEYLRANFTPRRIISLSIALVCFALCTATVLGWVDLKLWQTALLLFVGLLFYEWAG